MKNDKKGFTLIELLAVIVILAIIILIAVNVIIPLINKSKKKSFIDEANVYINGAMNYRAIDTDSGTADSTCVTIEELNQEYIKKHSSNYSGVVKIDNVDGELVPTIYLTNGKYYVVGGNNITTSNVTTEEPDGFKTSCVEPISFEVGDRFKISNDEFYFIGSDDNNIKLLPIYNLDNDGLQSQNTPTMVFSDSNFWKTDSTSFNLDSYGKKYVYRNKNGQLTDNNLKGLVNKYKDHIEELNIIDLVDIRLMSYEEARNMGCEEKNDSCTSTINQEFTKSFWTGSANSNWAFYYNPYNKRITSVTPNNHYLGCRPVIIILGNITFTGTGTDQDPYVITG